jgi:hypothetical protein
MEARLKARRREVVRGRIIVGLRRVEKNARLVDLYR